MSILYKIKKKIKKIFLSILDRMLSSTNAYNKYVFSKVYKENLFNKKAYIESESISGPGSDRSQTQTVIKLLPDIFIKYNIMSIIDIPCGDFNWMREVDFSNISSYTGGDIVENMINKNNTKYSNEKIKFSVMDIVNENLPDGDLLLVRDLFVHMKYAQIRMALKRIAKSNIKYLLTTSFIDHHENRDIEFVSEWRTINLQAPPFSFPKPLEILIENCTERNNQFLDKSLLLYKVSDLVALTF